MCIDKQNVNRCFLCTSGNIDTVNISSYFTKSMLMQQCYTTVYTLYDWLETVLYAVSKNCSECSFILMNAEPHLWLV